MCAIFGIIGEYDKDLARKAIGLLSHRGPDYCGVYEKKEVFISHNRLSIVDLNERASQPMIRDEVVLSFNGEIYNFQALKKDLDIDFETHSDTEVVLRAYQKYGFSFVDYLEGMFAISLYDKGKLYLFRDRLGKKPLYYMRESKSFIFASEIKAILPFVKRKRLNKDALHSYLSFLAPTPPHTFYEGVEKLESGHFAIYDKGKLEVKSYYDVLPSKISITSEKEALEQIESVLSQSIEKRLMGDVEVASLLSGGVDSSLIAAMSAKAGTKLKTFSLGYEHYFEYMDIQKAGELKHNNWLNNHLHANFSMHREWEWYKRIFSAEVLFRSSGEKFTDLQKNLLMKANVKDGFSMQYLQKYRNTYESHGVNDESQWYSYLDLKHFQAEHFLTKLDRVSMAHGVEGRTPFLDHTLVELVFSMDPSLRYKAGATKDLLKKVAKPYLSENIITRKKKGFSSPYLEWLIEEGELERIVKVNNETGLFHKSVLQEYIAEGKKGRYKQHIWGLYLFSRWYENEFM